MNRECFCLHRPQDLDGPFLPELHLIMFECESLYLLPAISG